MSDWNAEPRNVCFAAKGVLVLSPSFGILSLNGAAKTLLGCDLSPGEAWPIERFVASKDLAAFQDAVGSVFKQGQSIKSLPATIVRANGRLIPCQWEFQPLVSADRQTIAAMFSFFRSPRDTKAEAGTDLWMQSDGGSPFGTPSLFDHLPKGSFTIDAQWRITAFNQAAEQMTGFSRQEALGRPCWDIFRSDACSKQCPMRQALDRKQPEMDRQVFSMNRAGRWQTLSVNVSLLKNPRGEIVGAVETFHPAGDESPAPLAEPGRLQGIIGNSPAMRTLFARLPDLAASRANVLICGESGTGKELLARTLHQLSKPSNAPFVAVNCAALPETLIEAELFGCEKGAFTGADQSRPGRFELAGRGTLLLDEIGELKPDLQVKLLRVIEQRCFERVGGTRSIRFEARLISATHTDMAKAIIDKRFREDLFYRLRTVTLVLPSLRQRPEDIPLLTDHFIKKFNAKTGKNVRSLDPKVLRGFMAYAWPGNVRELERCIEHAFVFVKGPVIFERYLPKLEAWAASERVQGPMPSRHIDPDDSESVLWALNQTGGRREAASKLLGISRTSMWRRMKTLGLA